MTHEIEIRVILNHRVLAKDLYARLGVDPDASEQAIKSAYRKLAGMYHPDHNPGSDHDFQFLSEAYTVLSDKEKRQLYDRFGNLATEHHQALSEALHLLPRLFLQALRDHDFKLTVDYFAEIRKYIKTEERQLVKNQQQLKTAEKRLRAAEKRIKLKNNAKGSNIFTAVFAKEYQQLESQREALKKQEFLYTTMGKLMDDYCFEVDSEVEAVMRHWASEGQRRRSHRPIGVDDQFGRW